MSREYEEKRGPRGADEHVGKRFPRERKSEERVPVRERDTGADGLIEGRNAVTEALRAAGEGFRLLLLSDHMTYMANGAHGADPVPFVLYDSRVSEGSGLPYSEANGAKGPYVDDGAQLMDLLFELKAL